MASSNSACTNLATEPAIRTITLRPTGRLEGRMVCDDKAAIKSAHVYVYQEDFLGEHTSGIASPDVSADGRFLVPAFAEGPIKLIIRVDQSLAIRPRIPERLEIYAGKTTDVAVPFERTVRARGRVETKGDGAPSPRDGVCLLWLVSTGRKRPDRCRWSIRGECACRRGAPATHHKSGQVCRLDRRGGRLGYRDQGSRRGGDLRSAAAGLGRNRGACRSSCRSLESSRGGGGRLRRYRQPPLRFGKSDASGAFTLRLPISFKIEEYEVGSRESASTVKVIEESPLVLQVRD